MRSILDPAFKYTNSVETDLRKTFQRIYTERLKREVEQAQIAAASNVTPLPRKEAK